MKKSQNQSQGQSLQLCDFPQPNSAPQPLLIQWNISFTSIKQPPSSSGSSPAPVSSTLELYFTAYCFLTWELFRHPDTRPLASPLSTSKSALLLQTWQQHCLFVAVWCHNSPRGSNPNTAAQDASWPYFLLKSFPTIQLWLTCLTSKAHYTRAVPSKLGYNQEIPGGPVVMTYPFHCCGLGLIPGQVTKIP